MSDEEERPAFGGPGGLGSRPDWTQGIGLGWSNTTDDHNGNEDEDLEGPNSENNNNDEDWFPPRKRQRMSPPTHSKAKGEKSSAATTANAGGAKMTFAQRQMAKMGWKQGEGLGAAGKGRLNPIEVVQRPGGAGVGMVKEKTKQAKEEEKRAAAFRGEVFEDSSEEERKRKKAAKARRVKQQGRTAAPQMPARSKPKYVTVDELKADLGGSDVPRSLLEFAIDLNGKRLAAGSDTFVPASSRSIEEDAADKEKKKIQRELLSCAESKHGLADQRASLDDLQIHLTGTIDIFKEQIAGLEDLLRKIDELQEVRLKINIPTEGELWEEITAKLEAFAAAHGGLNDDLGFQDIIVAAISPVFRASMDDWDPFKDPDYLVEYFARLKALLEPHQEAMIETNGNDRLGNDRVSRRKRSTDAYGSMIYTILVPRLSRAIADDFDVMHPEPLLKVIRAWRSFIPDFAWYSFLNQQILPKLHKALKQWTPSRHRRRSHHDPDYWIFPWLEFLPKQDLDKDASGGIVREVYYKLRGSLAKHPVQHGIPLYLPSWEKILGSAYSRMITNSLLPRLSAYLSERLVIDPSEQDTEPLETILKYTELFSTGTMARLLAAEFFPKFHAILLQWLKNESADYDEVMQWWMWWQGEIPKKIKDHHVLEPEWTWARKAIENAMNLGAGAVEDMTPPNTSQKDRPAKRSRNDAPWLANPNHNLTFDASMTSGIQGDTADDVEVTFHDVVLDWCAEHDLLCVPTREKHQGIDQPIMRITARMDQKGGCLAYVRENFLYVRGRKDGSAWIPMELGPELEKKASER